LASKKRGRDNAWRDMISKDAIFTNEEDRNIMLAIHPDNSPSKGTRDIAMCTYNSQRGRLIAGPPKKRTLRPHKKRPKRKPPPPKRP
jgi:hypothetical protein